MSGVSIRLRKHNSDVFGAIYWDVYESRTAADPLIFDTFMRVKSAI
jgi:hypothetical protein